MNADREGLLLRAALNAVPRAGFEAELLHTLRALPTATTGSEHDEHRARFASRNWIIAGSIASAVGVGVVVYQWTRSHAGRKAA